MSASQLPENADEWPDDPFQLLGVEFGVELQELRRAYHRLIRVYKPEKHPEHFRRIRAAYEIAQQITESFPRPSVSTPPTQEQLPPSKQSTDATPVEPGKPEELPTPNLVSQEDLRLKIIWEGIRSGNAAAGYQLLLELNQHEPKEVASYLRLYWLLKLYPDLDLAKTPKDWLVDGLVNTELNLQLLELYRDEVHADPAEALGARFDRLLCLKAAPELLVDLAEWRFTNAMLLDRIDRLSGVLDNLRPWLTSYDNHWLHLHYYLAVRVAWSDHPLALELLQQCEVEMKNLGYLANKMGHLFDRFDLLSTSSAAWRMLKKKKLLAPEILQIFPETWYRPMGFLRARIQKLLLEIRINPGLWLDKLDLIYKKVPKAPILINQLYQEISSMQEEDNSEGCPPEILFDLVRQLLTRIGHKQYSKQRKKVLEFCLKEWISPYQIAQVECPLSPAWANLWNQYANGIVSDLPLFHTFHACRFSLKS